MTSSLPPVPFDALPSADLTVGRVYQQGPKPNYGGEVLQPLMGAGTSGGFRIRNVKRSLSKAYCVLSSTGGVDVWPDKWLDKNRYAYFGDQRVPGKDLLDTSPGGNQLLADVQAWLKLGEAGRDQVPPFFLFESTGQGRNVRFEGLLVPASDDLWLTVKHVETSAGTITNYLAIFARLSVDDISRQWLSDRYLGVNGSAGPKAWTHWVATGETA